jgi:phage major head subunit gpT-like protein
MASAKLSETSRQISDSFQAGFVNYSDELEKFAGRLPFKNSANFEYYFQSEIPELLVFVEGDEKAFEKVVNEKHEIEMERFYQGFAVDVEEYKDDNLGLYKRNASNRGKVLRADFSNIAKQLYEGNGVVSLKRIDPANGNKIAHSITLSAYDKKSLFAKDHTLFDGTSYAVTYSNTVEGSPIHSADIDTDGVGIVDASKNLYTQISEMKKLQTALGRNLGVVPNVLMVHQDLEVRAKQLCENQWIIDEATQVQHENPLYGMGLKYIVNDKLTVQKAYYLEDRRTQNYSFDATDRRGATRQVDVPLQAIMFQPKRPPKADSIISGEHVKKKEEYLFWIDMLANFLITHPFLIRKVSGV